MCFFSYVSCWLIFDFLLYFLIIEICQMSIWCLCSAENVQIKLNRYKSHPLGILQFTKNAETNIKMRTDICTDIKCINKIFCINNCVGVFFVIVQVTNESWQSDIRQKNITPYSFEKRVLHHSFKWCKKGWEFSK